MMMVLVILSIVASIAAVGYGIAELMVWSLDISDSFDRTSDGDEEDEG